MISPLKNRLSSSAKPEVIPVESSVTAVLGSTVELSVTVKADPPATPTQITWFDKCFQFSYFCLGVDLIKQG